MARNNFTSSIYNFSSGCPFYSINNIITFNFKVMQCHFKIMITLESIVIDQYMYKYTYSMSSTQCPTSKFGFNQNTVCNNYKEIALQIIQ